jgi:hypothetical protein
LQWILKLTISLMAIATIAALAAQATATRKRVAGATAAALTALVGLTTLQAISRQVFVVGYAPPVEAIAVVGGAFFLFGAFVVWATQKWPRHTIPSSVGAITYSWIAIGLSLATWAIGELATQDHYASDVKSWVIILALSILAVVAGLSFRRGTALGRVLIRVVSGLALLYSAFWLHRGGLDEAIGYWPAIVLAVALSIYSLVVSLRLVRPNRRLERP